MKLIAVLEDGKQVELKEIEGLSPGCELVFIRLAFPYRPEDVEKMEKQLTEKIGKKIVLLDPRFGEVFVM